MIEAGRPRFAVVIPAHNEAAVLGRCLSGWINDLAPGEAEVVVVANGCTDTTAQVARDLGARVVELDTASKSAALTAGDHAVTAFPRIYLDADIRVTAEGLRGLVAALEGPEPRVGAPAVRFVTGGASRTVRAFYRMYERLPYARKGLVGLGLYGLSESGRARFGDFPELTADDLFVQRLFSPQERVTVSATFDVLVPRDLSSLIKIRRRTATGNRELESADLPAGVTADVSSTARATLTALVRQVRAEPGRALDALVYLGVVLAARMGSRLFGKRRWERDESTRGGAASREHLVDEATPRGGDRVGYLVSMFPALSHAFIEREIRALEQLGVEVVPFSVRPCPPEQLLSEEMRWDAARTTVLKTTKFPFGLLAFTDLLFRAPGALLKGLVQALRTGVATPRARLWQLFYLAEAVLLLKLARQRGVRHFHVHFANNGADIARRAVAVGCAADGLGAWTWSLAMHGPTEFKDPERFDLVAKADDASFVACISEYVIDELRRLGASSQKLRVVHMGVDVDRFPGLSAERAARPAGPLRVLFVGRLVREKAPGVLLEAVSRLRESGRDVEAAIVGGGELADELAQEMEQRGLRECVRLLGPRGQEELPDWYAWADVFCLPSLAEGVPVVLMEAMASELPVVTTRIAGIPELVRDGETGLLVDPDDATRVVDSLARLDDDPDLRAVLGRAGRQLVIEGYTPGSNARLLRGLFQQVGD